MDKGYYNTTEFFKESNSGKVAIHNKNGQGLLLDWDEYHKYKEYFVAIHNKNGQGLLQFVVLSTVQ